MPRVLIVEDDELIAKGMATHLAEAGFDPLWMGNGEAGLARLRFERPDVCVLDLMMPLLDGWKLIETARAEGIGTPIVVVSARGSEQDRVHALEIGADDYLVKPFSMSELVARVGSPPEEAFAPRRYSAARGSKSRNSSSTREVFKPMSTAKTWRSRRPSSGSCTPSPPSRAAC